MLSLPEGDLPLFTFCLQYCLLNLFETWFIRYIFSYSLQFLNNVIIDKTKVLLPQAYVTF